MSLQGKVAIVTGGVRGIGRAVCAALARAGADVAVLDLSSADETVGMLRALGRRAEAYRTDVSDHQSVARAVAAAGESLGRIDILVSNAGITTNVAPLVKMKPEAWENEIRINLGGLFNCAQAVLPGMVATGWGRIVATSSIAGQMGGFGQAAYAASKAGLTGLIKTIALEHARDNITANAIQPGLVDTDAAAAIPAHLRERIIRTAPVQRMGTAEEVAAVVAFLVSPSASYINGAVIPVTAGCELFTF